MPRGYTSGGNRKNFIEVLWGLCAIAGGVIGYQVDRDGGMFIGVLVGGVAFLLFVALLANLGEWSLLLPVAIYYFYKQHNNKHKNDNDKQS